MSESVDIDALVNNLYRLTWQTQLSKDYAGIATVKVELPTYQIRAEDIDQANDIIRTNLGQLNRQLSALKNKRKQ